MTLTPRSKLPYGIIVFKCDVCSYLFKIKTTDHDSSLFEECPKCDFLCEYHHYFFILDQDEPKVINNEK